MGRSKEALGAIDQAVAVGPRYAAAWRIKETIHLDLRQDGKAKAAFEKLTKGRQREYAEYIGSAKRAETRQSRLEKCLPMIADGVGLNDRYR